MSSGPEEWPLSSGNQGAHIPAVPLIGPLPSESSFPFASPPFDSVSPIPFGAIENPALSSLSIILPALNEEDGVAAVMNRIPHAELKQRGFAYSVYLLDGRSSDRTRSVAKKLGAEIFIQTGSGKGSAFREFVPKIKEQLTVILDSDGTYPPEIIPDLAGKLNAENPVVLGSRLRGSIGDGAMSNANLVGNRFLSWFASFLFGTPVSDVCSGMWAFVSDRLKSLDLTANGFELEADIFAECALKGIPIVEVPIRYDRRIGVAKLRLHEGFRIAFSLLRKRLRSASIRDPGVAAAGQSAGSRRPAQRAG